MKLEYLKLTNFRGFREFEIPFDPQFTVLLGGNMAGKTAVLDGAAFRLRRLLGPVQARNIEDDDVRQVVVTSGGVPLLQPEFPVLIEARTLEDRPQESSRVSVAWQLYRGGANKPTENADGPYTLLNFPINKDLPVLAHFGVHRNWGRKQIADDLKGIGNRYDGYTGAFDTQSAHAIMAGWIRKQPTCSYNKVMGTSSLNSPR
ncbi:MAG TPA: AAA family ATPase [Kofleriaceae bacterium]